VDPFDWSAPPLVLVPGPATSADLNSPTGVAVDAAGNLYILDNQYRQVLKVTTGGTLSVVAGTGNFGAPTPGAATSSDLKFPSGIALDSSGNLYIADSGSNQVLKVTSGGTLSVFAGTGSTGLPTAGPATSSKLGTLTGIAVDADGNVFVSDSTNNVVEKITPAGALTVVAGTGYAGAPTAGPIADTELGGSTNGVATDASGNLYVFDSTYYLLEKVTFGPTAVAPDAPTSLNATPGNGSVSISFTAGADGGASITKYQYQLGSGSWTDAVGTTSPISISGLTNGTNYSIKLRAVNSVGAGAASSAVSVTPRTTPSAPTSLNVTPGDSTVSVAFTAGADGGSSIINYEYQLNGSGSWYAFSPAVTSGPVSIPVTNGVAYTVKLRAVNAAGSGAASSASASFTPATTPSAPTGLNATPGNGSVSISFTAGADGGASITKYQAQAGSGPWRDVVGTTSPISLSGLTNGTNYSIKLRAVNSVGAGTASDAVSVTPRTTPSAPTALVATPGDGSASVAFTAGSDGGAAISKYQYSTDGGTTWADADAGTTSPVTISGLTNYTSYSIKLRAVNSVGAGAASSAVSVRPGLPGAVSCAGNALGTHRVHLCWNLVTPSQGSVVRYRATVFLVGTSTKVATCRGSSTDTSCDFGSPVKLAAGTTYDFRVGARIKLAPGRVFWSLYGDTRQVTTLP
ncbi:MAG: hypothetical protein EBX39_11265, partial [Actinobacteria bacterium]|nr:hypothetical protein [Actinomycetota bacterium]